MISVLAPWFFISLLPAGALLVWAYRSQGSGKRVTLGSLLLLEQLQEKVTFRQKFLPPIRFFVELVLFILLVMALSGVVLRSNTRTYALIVDNSEGTGHFIREGRTILDELKAHVPTWVTLGIVPGSALTTNYRVVVTSPSIREVTAQPVSGGELKSVLEEISAVAGSDNLQEAIQVAAQFEGVEEILVLSDKNVELKEKHPSIRFESYSPDEREITLDNLAIESSTFRGVEQSLDIALRSFHSQHAEGVISLYQVVLEKSEVVRKPLRRAKFVLEPGERTRVQFENVNRNGAYYAELTTPDTDSLPSDNEIWITTETKERQVFVDSKKPLGELHLVSFPGLTYEIKKSTDTAFSIFYKSDVANIRAGGLYVLPLVRESERKALSVVEAGELVRSKEEHPVLDYVDLATLEFGEVVPLSVPDWAEPLIEVEAGVIAYVGLTSAGPVAVFGFELFPLDGSNTPTQTVLYLNAVKWLFRQVDGGARALIPGQVLREESDVDYRFVSSPKFKAETLMDGALPAHRGLLFKNGNIVEAVHFYSADESGSALNKKVLLTMPFKRAQGVHQAQYSIHFWLWLALLLFALDLFFNALVPRYAVRS